MAPRFRMNVDQSLEWCAGCAVPVCKRVNLPEAWSPGDPLPKGLTVHGTARDRRAFAFRGDPARQDRVVL